MNQHVQNRNENPYRPAPLVQHVLKNFRIEHASHYLDGYYQSKVVPFLAKKYNVSAKNVLLFYGIEDFFRSVFTQLQKKILLTHKPHYSYYGKYATFVGCSLKTFRLLINNEQYQFDIADCLKKINHYRPKCIIITSPNNPTGNSITPNDLLRILQKAPKNCLTIVDEAYWGFDPNYDEKAFLLLLRQYPNLILLRTFSKYYGLAGLRIGFGLCGSNVKNLISYQSRYLGLSRILEETAIAALTSESYYKTIAAKIIADRDWLIHQTNQTTHFTAYRSSANFIIAKTDKRHMSLLHEAFKKKPELIWKPVDKISLRTSIGTHRQIASFIKILQKVDAR